MGIVGGHTVSNTGYSPDCHLNIVGCLLKKKKGLQRGGGQGHLMQGPPSYALGLGNAPGERGFRREYSSISISFDLLPLTAAGLAVSEVPPRFSGAGE